MPIATNNTIWEPLDLEDSLPPRFSSTPPVYRPAHNYAYGTSRPDLRPVLDPSGLAAPLVSHLALAD